MIATTSGSDGSLVRRVMARAPGFALTVTVAVAAYFATPLVARVAPVPAMLIALGIGMALNPVAVRWSADPGISFCVKSVMRWAVALLGLRVGLSDIAALGFSVGLLVVLAMLVTLCVAFYLTHLDEGEPGFAALIGAATAVCGASATLATSTVVPDYPKKAADVAFVVIAANTLATVGMVLYPPLCALLGLDAQSTGIMLGATIHDVAQVVGAGYAVSEPVGNTAVIVKLFRVLLLLPVVIGIGIYLTRHGGEHRDARVPVPMFALVFLALCLINSAMPMVPVVAASFAPVKAALMEASSWGLMMGIAALGLSTSVGAVASQGWRHAKTAVATAITVAAVTVAGLLLIQFY